MFGHKCRHAFVLAAGLSAMAALALAQPQAAPLTVNHLGGAVYWSEGGSGGNTGIIVGDNGVIVIDAKTTPDSARDMLAQIAKITPKPVTDVILTHSDGDHVNGLAAFPKGITIIAHENNKKEMEAALSAGGRGAPPKDYMPTQVVTKNRETVTLQGVKLELMHWAPAHTSGDLVIYVPGEKVVFTGDIFTNRPDPLIHLQKNGSSAGWIETAKGISDLDADTFVPGHGQLMSKDDVKKSLKTAEEKRDKIKKLVAQGKSLDDVRKAVGDPPPAQGGRGPAFQSFTEVVYQELAKK